MAESTHVRIGEKTLALTNLDKVLYPDVGFTKAHVLDYYARIAPHLLPHLKGRALTLKRYPDGVEGPFFFQKDCPMHRPPWMPTLEVWSEHRGKNIHFCSVDDLASLLWLVNIADLEFHAGLAHAPDLDTPNVLAFDLDPGAPADARDCARVALELKDWLGEQGLVGYPKTSGSKGLQVYVPLNTPCTFDDTKAFARRAAEALERNDPRRITSNMRKDLRRGRVFIDWSQNDDHKTTVCPYSLRAKARPTVSTPLRWREVESGADAPDLAPLTFESDEVLRRVEEHGDLFEPVLTRKQSIESRPVRRRAGSGRAAPGATASRFSAAGRGRSSR